MNKVNWKYSVTQDNIKLETYANEYSKKDLLSEISVEKLCFLDFLLSRSFVICKLLDLIVLVQYLKKRKKRKRHLGLVMGALCQLPGRPGFNPRSSHTKDFKNGTWCLLP